MRVIAQAVGRSQRERRVALGARQHHHLAAVEPAQDQALDALGVVEQPRPAGLVLAGPERTGRDQHTHPIGVQAAQREQQRAGRPRVDPVSVVDKQRHGPLVLQRAENRQQLGADRERARGRAIAEEGDALPVGIGSRTGHQLGNDPVVEVALGLVPARRQDDVVLHVGQAAADERGLADPRLSLDHHDPRAAGASASQGSGNGFQLGPSPDEPGKTCGEDARESLTAGYSLVPAYSGHAWSR